MFENTYASSAIYAFNEMRAKIWLVKLYFSLSGGCGCLLFYSGDSVVVCSVFVCTPVMREGFVFLVI